MVNERYVTEPKPVAVEANQQALADSVFKELTKGKEPSLGVILPKIPEGIPTHYRIPVIVASTSTKNGVMNLDLHMRHMSLENLLLETDRDGAVWTVGTKDEVMPHKPNPDAERFTFSAVPDPFMASHLGSKTKCTTLR